MKRRILVLDPYTNGHDAARRFISRQGWKSSECDIVFCGSHNALLQRLTEAPAYAVVPVFNSSKGEVTSVTSEINRLKKIGYDFETVDTLPLRIRHCLLAPQYVDRVEQLIRVLSKSEAMNQCDRWLSERGLEQDKRSAEDSTGTAALHVSRLKQSPRTMIGAVAPRAAAKAYGLKILATNIQDDAKNTTTFLLLHNKAVPEKCVVGIVGINGRFGLLLKEFFERLGCRVIGSDRKVQTAFSNAEVVKRADVVIFAVTVKRTVSTIKSVVKHTRKDQLLMDVTSVKRPAVEAMLKGKAQVVGLHPMFAPSLGFEGQTVIVCPERLTNPRWKTWVVNMLSATGSKLKFSDPESHDKYMVTVQVGPQSANLVSALVVTETGVPVGESLEFTSPFYRLMFSLMGRLLTQDPALYASIIMQNPGTVEMLERRIEIEQRLVRIIQRKDHGAFVEWFKKAQAHFGSEIIAEANRMFSRLNAVTKTSSSRNSITLEFSAKDNKPGLLAKVLAVFHRKRVNLSGINFVSLDPRQNQFCITTDEPKGSNAVMQALRTIEGWKDPKIKVIA